MNKFKKIALLAIICAALGCGSEKPKETADETASESAGSAETNTETQQTDTATTVTKENFMSFPVTPESEFTGTAYEDGYEIQSCSSKDAVIVVPEEINGLKVLSIGNYALCDLECEAIVLPDTVKYIGEAALSLNSNMKYVYLGNSVENIGELAFNSDNSLVEINLPESTKSVNQLAAYCKSLERVYAPAGLTDIQYYLLFECPNATVYTPAGSAAEASANEAGIPVVNE